MVTLLITLFLGHHSLAVWAEDGKLLSVQQRWKELETCPHLTPGWYCVSKAGRHFRDIVKY